MKGVSRTRKPVGCWVSNHETSARCCIRKHCEVFVRVLYLFDANVLITANNTYYPIDQLPEFWSWVQHHGNLENIKIPIEMMEEILAGRKSDDLLLDWMKNNQTALKLNEAVETTLVQ